MYNYIYIFQQCQVYWTATCLNMVNDHASPGLSCHQTICTFLHADCQLVPCSVSTLFWGCSHMDSYLNWETRWPQCLDWSMFLLVGGRTGSSPSFEHTRTVQGPGSSQNISVTLWARPHSAQLEGRRSDSTDGKQCVIPQQNWDAE